MNRYIADLHLGHANIIFHTHRPFTNVDEMDKVLIENWNNVVSDNDDVWILGDLTLDEKSAEKYLKMLKDKKHLIVGNHDRYIRDANCRKYFASIHDYKKIQDGKNKIVLFHYPIAEWDGYYRDTIHLYGHIHNSEKEAYKTMKERRNCYNVGADCIGFTPRTLQEIINIYSNK